MENIKQKIAAEFDRYQAFLTEKERQAFWQDIENQADELTPDQRLTAQTRVRENIDQILQQMEAIKEKLLATEVV